MNTQIIRKADNSLHLAKIVIGKKRGWRSDPLVVYELNTGYRVTPFEFKLRWKFKDFSTAMGTLLSIIYLDDMKELIYNSNPLLKNMSK